MSQDSVPTSNINWAELTHAYGPATDVPYLLNMLESDEKSDRKNAMHEFYGNVFHQGTRYPASAAIVPFLTRLAASPAVHDRDQIIGLISSISLGYDHFYVPKGIDIASQRKELEERR